MYLERCHYHYTVRAGSSLIIVCLSTSHFTCVCNAFLWGEGKSSSSECVIGGFFFFLSTESSSLVLCGFLLIMLGHS